jgi:RNA polymerase sigma-70 factor (ECF subfamily)
MRVSLDDLEGFERLYREHYAYVWAVLRRLGVDAIADAHQEVFLTVYRRRDTFDPTRPIRSWLVGIARRVASRARRGQQRADRRRSALASVEASCPRRPALEGRVEAREFLAWFLEHLDERHREVFVLGELEGRTGVEIAQALDIKLDTAYARLRVSRARFKRALLAVEPDRQPGPARLQAGLALLLPRLREPAKAGWLSVLGGKVGPSLGAMAAAGLVVLAVRGPSAPAEAPPSAPAVSTPEAMSASDPVHASVAEPPLPPSAAPTPAVPVPEPIYTPRPRSGPLAPARSTEPDADARLAEETRRLTAARTALDAGRPGLALEVLQAHARDFPRSPLAEARGALRVEVLCVQGKGAQARGEAQVLLRHHPESNLARHAVTRCRDSP